MLGVRGQRGGANPPPPVCRPQREKLILQLEEERRLRLESEKRLREVTEEAELGRAQMASLQRRFSRYRPQDPQHTCVCQSGDRELVLAFQELGFRPPAGVKVLAPPV